MEIVQNNFRFAVFEFCEFLFTFYHHLGQNLLPYVFQLHHFISVGVKVASRHCFL